MQTDQTTLRVRAQEWSDAIDEAERELASAATSFLKGMGWKRTCRTPGSCWLWERDFSDVDARWREIEAEKEARDGKPFPTLHKPIGRVICDEGSAINMSRASLDLLFGEHPEASDD